MICSLLCIKKHIQGDECAFQYLRYFNMTFYSLIFESNKLNADSGVMVLNTLFVAEGGVVVAVVSSKYLNVP